MTNRNKWAAATGIALATLLGAGLIGCEEKKKPVVVAPPPPPPPRPQPVDVAALIQQEGSDARVQFNEAHAPTDPELAKAAIHLADALARGDADDLKKMLDRKGQQIVDELVGRAEWEPATQKIEAVRITQLMIMGTATLISTAIQEPGGAYLLNWTASATEGGFTFSPTPAASGTQPRASAWDTANVVFSAHDMAGLENVDPESLTEGGEGDAGSEPTRDPMRKNTPGGPITIPNPGGGSPGGG